MQKKTLGMLSAALLVGILCTACQEKEGTEEPKEAISPVEETTEIEKETPVTEAPSEGKEIGETITPPPPPASEKPKEKEAKVDQPSVVNSGEEAIEHLKKKIEEGANEDVSFGSDGFLETDEKGSFYYVRLTSISLRLAGGTGSLDTYKVYQDGTFETIYQF